MEDKSKKYFFKKGRAILVASLFVLAFSALGLYYFIFIPNWPWLRFLSNPVPVVLTPSAEETIGTATTTADYSDCKIRWLDGIKVDNEAAAEVFPVAVVIDNDVLARPQNGLSKASLVYEAPVEGGMTRYLAIFPADADLSAVGPVRSARPYFVAWASGLKALFVHCGGSPDALAQVKQAPIYDLNEFYNGNYFWRDNSSSRRAPHNVLISGDNWRSYLSKRGLNSASADTWLFKEEGEHALTAPDLNLYFSANFHALWRYNADSNDYKRFFNGTESRDEGNQITAKNIIIQYVNSQILDNAGRLALEIAGEGKADICLDGTCQFGVWRQKADSRTRYYYENGDEIKLNPGVTWIEVAGSNTRVE